MAETTPGLPAARPTALPTVTVIVPARDGLDELKACVDRLLAQDYPADLVTVIVADNGSAVPPASHLPDDPRLTVVSEPRPGSYAARNTALRVATGEVIAFTDADCRPSPSWLTEAVAALDAAPAADMVGGAVRLFFEHGRPISGPEWFEQLRGFPQEDYLSRGFSVTANLVTRRSVLEEVGYFDASLASGGDAEWGRRVREAGGVQRYAPGAVVEHPARATRTQLLTKSRRTTEGVAIKARRRPDGRRRILRMLLGHLRATLVLTVTVWGAAEPDTMRGRARYLGIVWANSGVICAELIRALGPRYAAPAEVATA